MSYTTPAKKRGGGVETVTHTQFIFPVLKNSEILQCLDELGIEVSKSELAEPHRHREKVRKIFWQLLEHCSGVTEDDIEKRCPTNLERFVAPEETELHENFLDVLFFQELRKLMKTCGIVDFSWKDIHAPTSKRLRCQLSATINMAKFREEQLKIYAELNEPRHQLLVALEELHGEQGQLQEQLNLTMAESDKKMEAFDVIAKECQELESEIARSNKLQAAKREEASQLKKEMTRLKDELAAATWSLQENEAEEERLLGQVVSSPRRRKHQLDTKKDALEKEKAETRRLQQEIEDGKVTTARLQKAIKDLEECISLQKDILDEASKYQEAAEHLDSTEKEVEANEEKAVEIQEKTNESERSLNRLEEKLAHMHKQSKLKMDAVQDNIDIAKEQLLIVEKDRREGLARVEAGESEVLTLKAQIEQETKSTQEEIAAIVAEYKTLEENFMKRNEQRMMLIDSAM
mmetsp:Transcript_6279/g.15261  ORF Transcript_6279/g.15261 Transcript_6279/m.15261 type:complete len:462 (-) Transcript_6279:196-1581(-)|eukprot:CAMPEP_0116102638 /NCGR_PEP_ID=MMETSP0327-20121206/13457_1 /TAXON_ID=44447 /ORGANISM="Pseudo-nitzschia delicatissima, Strain B596" /LENGTH=461 /DNA_ID=CAMNT_0003594693 /DNA_START=45 /DNA_END=1430 /DNA_ORIENTATION=-